MRRRGPWWPPTWDRGGNWCRAGKTGLLYRTGDVEQLASAIRFLSSQPELAEEMGRAGWERVRRGYTPEAHYEALVGLYERAG